MTSACRNLAPLLIFLFPLMHSRLVAHAASTSPPVTHHRIIFVTSFDSDDDYDGDYADTHTDPPVVQASRRTPLLQQEHQLCQYNPCLESQEPCASLSAKNGCLCPGISEANVPPHPPRIQALQLASDGEGRGQVEVQWCAPSSVVTLYKVVVEGREEDALHFRDASRRGLVGPLEVGTQVCVEAVNNAGHSTSSEFSCQRYDPPASSEHHHVLAWVFCGGVVLLLLIAVAVILWKCKVCQRVKTDSADGLGNPSYSREGTL
ncbi:leucine-rich repeat neuronal protein 4 [Gouania willdenowi]|uniref:Leucine-rich repeat neuronal protein 4-like n=1 Tax=Gouania willdenowi TaxID=441366 RepID=A0A8C5GVG3_GOUWI|nr:leucine-rich repeat neuronal protein 4-like [Gouania willdenowi]